MALRHVREPEAMAMDWDRLYRLDCGVQHYAWGERTHAGQPPYLARLLGQTPEPHVPFAELWIGAHPRLPSKLVSTDGAICLADAIRQSPTDLLGPGLAGRGKAELPILLKVLTCAQPLSIQAHPDRDWAVRLHARDHRNYPDPNPKPEIAIALSGLRALCQFRPAADIAADLGRLPTLRRFFAEELADHRHALAPGWLRQVYARTLGLTPTAGHGLLAQVAEEVRADTSQCPQDRLFLDLCSRFPGDKGVLSAYLLNLVTLAPGQALYMPPREPHAYLDGRIIECMVSSDNVVRAGLTPKFTDDQVLLEMLTYTNGRPCVFAGVETRPGCRQYPIPTAEFQVEVWLRPKAATEAMAADATFSLMLVTAGTVQLATAHQSVVASAGSAWLWPARVERLAVQFLEDGQIVRARPGPGLV